MNVVVQDNRDPFYQWLLRNRALGRIRNRPDRSIGRGVIPQPVRPAQADKGVKPARRAVRKSKFAIRSKPKVKIGNQ